MDLVRTIDKAHCPGLCVGRGEAEVRSHARAAGNFNDEGKVGGKISRTDEYYGGGSAAFYALIREWRAAGLNGLTIA